MNLKYILAWFFVLGLTIQSAAQELSPFIHVDQFGYEQMAEKVAVISNPQVGYNANESYGVGGQLQLVNEQTNEVVFSGSPISWNSNAVDLESGDAGWWFDFSSYAEAGSYYVYDPSTDHRSPVFAINENPYAAVLQAAARTFFYNRSGAPKAAPFAEANWTDSTNFPQDLEVRDCYDQNNAASARDMSGGWFDAGDYNKYVTFAHDPVHQLLTAYENNPSVFGDNWNLPESGDGLPDIINEIQWELDWLYKMVNADGTAHIKMGSLDYNINDLAPPSNNFSPRYYAPTCSSASLSVASIDAHAAIVFSQFPELQEYAAILESDALLTWNRFIEFFNNDDLQFDCDDQTVKAGDADWDEQVQYNNALIAAVYLFELTGEQSYSDFVRDNLNRGQPFLTNFWGPQHAVLLEALLNYSSLPNADSNTVAAIITSVTASVNNDWGGYFGFSNDDLYRANAPEWVFYWGSNMTMANLANLCNTVARYDVVPSANDDLRRKAAEQVHYFHGVNPQGLVYLSNMYSYGAERSANEIFHTWFNEGTDWDNALTSPLGPAPGFLAGGPNQGYTGNFTPPSNQPVQKAYLDYNDGFTDVSYEITEPAIYYQAAYIQMLSNYVNTDVVLAAPDLPSLISSISISPNPFSDSFELQTKQEFSQLKLYDATGKLCYSQQLKGRASLLISPAVLAGLYFVNIYDKNSELIYSKKIVKLD
ncbi:glycoside hydrolase family 9 protein [Chitinophagales bacterium]|nr:glycoside hydrolase family 9 protein [Chitinophagales bacterium]